MSENGSAREGECCVGMLIDLSSPVVEPDISNNENEDPNATCPIVEPDISNNNENEDANATFTFTDCIELSRSDRILKDVTDKVVSNSKLEDSPEMLLQDEIFDFDLVLSANESSLMEEHEEEVFFGPVGFTEKLVSTVVAPAALEPLSPLNPKQWAEIVKEARSIAHQLSILNVDSDTDDNTFNFPLKVPSKVKSPAKSHQRRGTFELEKPVETLLQDGSKIKIPSVDQETVDPVSKSDACADSVDCQENIPPVKNKLATKVGDKKQSNLMVPKVNRRSLTKKSLLKDDVQSKNLQSKLKKPSRLTQMKKNRSYTLLPKVTSCEDVNQPHVNITHTDVSCVSDTDSNVSDKSDMSVSRLHMLRNSLPLVCRNVDPVDVCAVERSRQYSGTSEANSETSSIASDLSDLSTSKLPTCSLPVKSSLLRRKSEIPGVGIKKPITAGQSRIPPVSNKLQPPKSKMPLAKPPIGLVRPGQLQKNKLVFPRSKPIATAPGPVKALVPKKPVVPDTKVGPDAKLNRVSKKPDVKPEPSNITPLIQQRTAMMKPASPLRAHRGSLDITTPIKSTSSSTSSIDTPGRRRSCLPTPTKRKPSSASSIPPSPLTNCNSTSSSASSWSRKLLQSDGCESPVFLPSSKKNRNGKPCNPPVQNTPDLPKRKRSMWSPVRRSQLNSMDQLFQCTKRSTDH